MLDIAFKKPDITDHDVIKKYFQKYSEGNCDKTFANVVLWADYYEVEFAEYKNTLLFKEAGLEGAYAYPTGAEEDVKQVIEELLIRSEKDQIPLRMYDVTRKNFACLEAWYPGKFAIEYDQGFADYVYETEMLASLKGKRLHGKRNHVNRFLKAYEGRWNYEKMSKDNLEECIEMARVWCRNNDCREDEEMYAEMGVTIECIRRCEEFGMTGGVLRADGKIVAFTVGEPASEEMFVVHIEKAYAEVDGAYPMINQQFVQNEILGKYRYVNREEDLGEEGLRQAKLSYKPAFLLEKGIVTVQK